MKVLGDTQEASGVRAYITADEARRNIAELGLGCNDRAVVTGNVLEDEKVLGMHWALGRSDHLGGTVGVDDFSHPDHIVHWDIVYPNGGSIEISSLVLQYEDGTSEEIIKDAEARALEIVANAKKEAETLLQNGRAELERELAAGKAAFKVAIRDTRLELAEELKAVFAAHVRRLIAAELRDWEFLRKLILAVAGRAREAIPDSGALDILIGKGSLDGADTAKEPLREFVLGVAGTMLREGVSLRPSGTAGAGIQIQLKGEDVESDLTQKTLSDLILKHLLPRYRKIVEGVD